MDTSVYEQVLKWVNMPLIYLGQAPVTLGGIGSALIVFFIFLSLSSLIQRILVQRLASRWKIDSGMTYALSRIVHYSMIVFGAVMAAQCVGLNLGSLAVMFGFLSVGIGFGLQNVTSNFIAGVILLLERPINVGDKISVEGQIGKVLQINMRTTIIETADNLAIIVPNGKFIESSVINLSYGDPRVRVHCPVGVAYGSDVARVKEILLKVASENKEALKSPTPEVSFIKFGDSSLDFELLVWSPTPDQQGSIRSELNYAIDAAFRKNNIEIPFPQRDIHIRTAASADSIQTLKK